MTNNRLNCFGCLIVRRNSDEISKIDYTDFNFGLGSFLVFWRDSAGGYVSCLFDPRLRTDTLFRKIADRCPLSRDKLYQLFRRLSLAP